MNEFLAWRIRSILPLLSRWRPARKKQNRVLCCLTGGLGDKLMDLPAVRALRAEFPEAELTLLIVGLIPPFFITEADRVLSLDKDDSAGLFREARRGYDAVFVNSIGVFNVNFEIAAFLSGSKDLRGPRFSITPETRTIYNHSYIFGEGHETLINFRGAGGSGGEDQLEYLLHVPPTTEVPKSIADVIFHPGSSAQGLTNRWPAEHYAQLARDLKKQGYSVLAIGTPPEKELLDALQQLAGEALTTRTDLSLEQLALQLGQAKLVVANDSGIGHLAAAMGANLITIIGANRPEKIATVGRRVTVIPSRCEYGGCYNDPKVPVCKMCITKITPAEVWQIAQQKLFA